MLPRRTFKDTSFTATKPLNSFVRPRVSSMVSSAKHFPVCCGAPSYRLSSMARRLPFLQEGIDSLAAFLVGKARGDHSRGELVGLRRAEIHLLVERALAGSKLRGRFLRQLARQLVRLTR